MSYWTDALDAIRLARTESKADLAALQARVDDLTTQLVAASAAHDADGAHIAALTAEVARLQALLTPPVVVPPKPVTPFGWCVTEQSGESYAAARTRQDATIGPARVLRVYLADTNPLKAWPSVELADPRPMQVSFKADIAKVPSGYQDAKYVAWFAAAPRDRDIFWTLFHEPDDNISAGQFTAAQYTAAWRHIGAIAKAAGNPRLRSALSLMNWSLYPESGRGDWRNMMAADVVDVLAWDNNNLGTAKGIYRPADQYLDPIIAASASVGKPWALAEWGSGLLAGDTGVKRAAWITSVGAYAREHGALYACWFESAVAGESRLLDAPSQAAYRALTA